jgi:hypothetical protein
MTRTVDIAGIAVELHATDAVRSEAVDATCSMLVDAVTAPTLRITFGAETHPLPDEPFDLADGDVRAWWRDETAYLAHGPFTATVRDAEARVGGDGNCRRAFRQLFPYVVTQLLAPQGRFALHGGAIERGGRAVLVLGGTGAGKSTVVASAMRAGWRPLADDLVVLRASADSLEVCGVAKPVTVERAVAAASGLPFEELDGDVRGRCQLLVDVERAWVPVGGTVVAAHGDVASSSWGPLTSPALTEWLLYSFLSRHDARVRTPYLAVVAATVRRGGLELRHGVDASRRIEGVVELLEEWSGTDRATEHPVPS